MALRYENGKCLVGKTAAEDASKKCVDLCNSAKLDLSNGPCLGEVVTDWVCDVAHSPREDVDNLEENQCAAYRSGEASHFVEVTPDCQFVRAA